MPRHLATRLANPPPLFVGREALIGMASAAIARGPVTVLVGPGGVGKSALLSTTLFTAYAEQAPEVRAFAVRRGEDLPGLLTRVLAGIAPRLLEGWERTEPLGVLIEALEQQPGWLVIEDLHNLPSDVVGPWLAGVARYLRGNRLVATSRLDPGLPELAEQVVQVAPLGVQEARKLVHACNPRLADQAVSRCVQAAQGLPLRLREAAVAARLDSAVIARASVVEIPVLPEVLGAPAAVREATRAGLLLDIGGRVRLHDVARESTRATLPADERWDHVVDLAASLVAQGPDGVLEAVRLLGERDAAEARRLAEANLADLLARGHAPALFRIARDQAEWSDIAWRCVGQIAGGDALAWAVRQKAPKSPEQALRWLNALALAGEQRRCLDEAQRLLERRLGTTFESTVRTIAARAALQSGQPQRAVELLEGVAGAHSRAVLAMANAALGQVAETVRLADGLAVGADPARWAAATAYASIGRGRHVDDILASWEAGDLDDQLIRSRAHRLTFTLRSIERGEIQAAERALERLQRFPPEESDAWHRHMQHLAGARLALAKGPLSGLDRVLDEVEADAGRHGEVWSEMWATMLRAVWSLACHASMPALSPTASQLPMSPPAAVHQACIDLQRAAQGRPALPWDPPDFIEVRLLRERARATRLLLEDQSKEAIECLEGARRLATQHALVLQELAVLRALGDAVLVAGDLEGAQAIAAELVEAGTTTGALRYGMDGRALRALVAGATTAEWLALAGNEASVSAARRARWCLGLPGGMDAIEQAVLGAAPAVHERGAVGGGAFGDAWGARLAQRQAWIHDGVVDLTARDAALLRCLIAGRGTKEELVQVCWERRSYDPARDDKRLHMAIRRLRDRVEADPKNPERILTTPDGYRLSDGLFLWTDHGASS